MARRPSGLGTGLPDDPGDLDVWLARVALTMAEHPLGSHAPCLNPECDQLVEHVTGRRTTLYCGSACRARTSTLRRNGRQQLVVLERLLAALPDDRDVERAELEHRASGVRFWLARLTAPPGD